MDNFQDYQKLCPWRTETGSCTANHERCGEKNCAPFKFALRMVSRAVAEVGRGKNGHYR